MDQEAKKKIKDLDGIIAILTFACVIVFIVAITIAFLLFNSIIKK